jgi:hypothetical protein
VTKRASVTALRLAGVAAVVGTTTNTPCDWQIAQSTQSCTSCTGLVGCGWPCSASAWQIGTPSAELLVASAPHDIVATRTTWHQAASHASANETADFISNALL